jgi:transcription initiation factor IIE alpha subunit
MPELQSYIDVDPSEFISACSKREIKKLIEILTDDGHIDYGRITSENQNLFDKNWEEALYKLNGNRLRLTIEEEETILKISKKF